MGKKYGTEELHPAAIAREAIKVRTNAHCKNSLPGQDLTLKVAQIFFVNSCE